MFFSKRNLIIILIICLILVFICMYRENNDLKSEKIVQTNGTPVSSHTVVLDAGHGEPDRTELVLIVALQSKR